jgi:hypothetical protein
MGSLWSWLGVVGIRRFAYTVKSHWGDGVDFLQVQYDTLVKALLTDFKKVGCRYDSAKLHEYST